MRPMTEAEIERMLALDADGDTTISIARKLGYHKQTIARRLRIERLLTIAREVARSESETHDVADDTSPVVPNDMILRWRSHGSTT